MGVRRQAREAAIQAIFCCDFVDKWDAGAASFCIDHFEVSETAAPFAKRLCEGVVENFVQIDSKLTCASENWSLSRMSRVDRSILRLATFEIVFFDEVPINVAINEAIEVAKRFGSEESPVFVNGVLDKVASTFRRKSSKSALEKSIEVVKEEDVESGDATDLVVESPSSEIPEVEPI